MTPEQEAPQSPSAAAPEPAAESAPVVNADLADAASVAAAEFAPTADDASAAASLQPASDFDAGLVVDADVADVAENAEAGDAGESETGEAGEDEIVLPPSRRSAAAKNKTKAKPKAEAKTKAPRKPARRKEKLPDLGDGSGYIAPDEVDVAGEEAPWFAVHCYSGQENKVKTNLEQRIETMGMAGKILKIIVPTEDEIEVRDGKRKTVKRHVYPGYVLVQMNMSEESWFVVRNTPGVTRFVGMGNRPQPLSQQEVNVLLGRMEAEAPKIKVNFRAGQKVRITDGPFADFIGVVDKIDTERAKVVALVSFFGRETPVELDFLQVERA
jgi:transcriptional antiterminator NusG